MNNNKLNTLSTNDNSEFAGAVIVDNSDLEDTTNEAREAAVAALGTAFHEDWRKTRQNEDGSFEPRVKGTKDESWIEANGTDQVDIANTDYANLPADWQAENKAAAEVVVDIFEDRDGSVDLSDEETRNEVGAVVHDAWLSRNEWARGGDLDVPFVELSEAEQSKDLDQVVVAQRIFSHE